MGRTSWLLLIGLVLGCGGTSTHTPAATDGTSSQGSAGTSSTSSEDPHGAEASGSLDASTSSSTTTAYAETSSNSEGTSTSTSTGDGTSTGAAAEPSSARHTAVPIGTDGAPQGFWEYLPPGYAASAAIRFAFSTALSIVDTI